MTSSQAWAAIMLTPKLDVCCSILSNRPVKAGSLDPGVFRHALRGASLPPAAEYIHVTPDMLAAIEEAAPLNLRKRG